MTEKEPRQIERRVMSQKTKEILESRLQKAQQDLRTLNSEFGGHQRDALHDDSATQNEINLLRGMIAKIGDLSSVEIIEPNKNIDTAGIGNEIEVRFSDGETEKITMLGPDDVITRENEADLQIASINSPLGKAIYGKSKGQKTVLKLKDRQEQITIVAIRTGKF